MIRKWLMKIGCAFFGCEWSNVLLYSAWRRVDAEQCIFCGQVRRVDGVDSVVKYDA